MHKKCAGSVTERGALDDEVVHHAALEQVLTRREHVLPQLLLAAVAERAVHCEEDARVRAYRRTARSSTLEYRQYSTAEHCIFLSSNGRAQLHWSTSERKTASASVPAPKSRPVTTVTSYLTGANDCDPDAAFEHTMQVVVIVQHEWKTLFYK